MNEYYKNFHKQALDLQYKFHDSINDHDHPMARVLEHQIHQLTQDIQGERNPRAIEDRVKIIQHQLIEARAQGEGLINHEHNQDLHHRYEYMRSGIRQLPHY